MKKTVSLALAGLVSMTLTAGCTTFDGLNADSSLSADSAATGGKGGKTSANETTTAGEAVSTGPLAPGDTCTSGEKCESGVCSGGKCVAPTGTDGVKNGDESDVDCGGDTTGAPRCATGKACSAHKDCESGGCDYKKKCVEVRSCTAHFGGDTCGAGEVGSGEENHETCCRSLEVAGFEDSDAPGKKVYLDKYEVTAGRVRAFVEQLTAQYGKPNIKRWVTENQPEGWDPDWTQYLASAEDGEEISVGNVGTNYAFGGALYIYVHGHNCFQGAGSFGFPTYWYPDDVMKNENAGLPRAATKDQLDVKSMTCIPNVVLAAFCAWDGGRLASAEVLNAATDNGRSLPPQGQANVTVDSGTDNGPYHFPDLDGANHEGVSRIAAPGRMTGDAVSSEGGESWMDLRGNLNEVARSGGGFALLYQGIGASSAHALQNNSAIPLPYYKAGYSGGRCMRYR